MTTEVAIMNRRALVLAADSAGTVTSWVNGKQEVRYFKGENKVFQLSMDHPVGLMTYGNAHIQHVPWDVIVKEFRREYGRHSYPTIRESGEALFGYVESNQDMFPAQERENGFISNMKQQIIRFALEASQSANGTKADGLSPSERRARFRKEIEGISSQVLSGVVHAAFTAGDVEKALLDYGDQAKKICDDLFDETPLLELVAGLENELFEAAVNYVFRFPGSAVSSTGIVVGGFGERDIFPCVQQFRVLGFTRQKLVWEATEETRVSARTPGEVLSFASKSMVETFTDGLNIETYVQVVESYSTSVRAMLKELSEQGCPVQDAEERIERYRKNFTDQLMKDTISQHNRPLRNVVSMLAIDEMANLAETLISLESLKEKVTRPTESVGGPVDVAAVTKAEGLIWIKRKHHFDLSLNPRYAAKLAQRRGAEQ